MNLVWISIFVLFYTWLCHKNISLGLSLILASLPLYVIRFSVAGVPTTLLELMILLCFAVFVFHNFRGLLSNLKIRFSQIRNSGQDIERSFLYRYPFDIEIGLVLVISFIAMGVAGFSSASLGIWKAYFFEALIVYLLVINVFLARAEKSLSSFFEKILLPLVLASFYVSLYAIYQKFTGFGISNEVWAAVDTRRVTSILEYPNAIGLLLGPIAIMSFGYLLYKRKYFSLECKRLKCEKWSPFDLSWFYEMPLREKLVFSFVKLSLLMSLLAIFFARSEGALIAILASLILFFFFLEPFKNIGKIRPLIIGLLIVVMVFVSSFSPLQKEFVKKIKLDDFSGQIRKAQWEETAIMLRDGHWLFGAGLANYQNVIEPYHKNGIYIKNDDPDFEELIKVDPEYQQKNWQALEIFLYPHNIFFNFWVELGLFGMLLFVFIICKSFYIGFSLLNREDDISQRILILSAIVALFGLAVHGIVDVPYFKNDLAILFWLLIAIFGAMKLLYEQKNINI